MSHYFNQSRLPEPYNTVGCGIACVIMALSRRGIAVSDRDIIGHVLARNGYLKGVGCRHAALARVLTDYGVLAYNQEFTPPRRDIAVDRGRCANVRSLGLQKVTRWVTSGKLVIVSVNRSFSATENCGHLVLVHGITMKNGKARFVIDDPDHAYAQESGSRLLTRYAAFRASWRRLAIFIE